MRSRPAAGNFGRGVVGRAQSVPSTKNRRRSSAEPRTSSARAYSGESYHSRARRMNAWNLPATYFIYAAFALISLFFVVRYLKETKGRSLEEMGS